MTTAWDGQEVRVADRFKVLCGSYSLILTLFEQACAVCLTVLSLQEDYNERK